MLPDCTYEEGVCTQCGHIEGDPPHVMRDTRPVYHLKTGVLNAQTICGRVSFWLNTVVLDYELGEDKRLCKDCTRTLHAWLKKVGFYRGGPRQCD